jgi:hypothetical protein
MRSNKMRSPGAAFDLRATMTQELNAALEELDAGSGPKAMHRCRVRLKRARAVGRVGRSVAPGLAAVFNDSARTVMRQLGQARDLTALADTARTLAVKARRKNAPGLLHAADALETARLHLPERDLETIRAGIRDLIALAQVCPSPLRGRSAPGRNASPSARGARVAMAAAPTKRGCGTSGASGRRTAFTLHPCWMAHGPARGDARKAIRSGVCWEWSATFCC